MTEFLNRTLENLRRGPAGPVVRWIEAHPRLSAWVVLALGMDIILVVAARDVGLLPHQWAAVLIATTLTAGACVWIISWEDEPFEEEGPAARQGTAQQAPAPEPSKPDTEETAKAAPKKRTRKPKAKKYEG